MKPQILGIIVIIILALILFKTYTFPNRPITDTKKAGQIFFPHPAEQKSGINNKVVSLSQVESGAGGKFLMVSGKMKNAWDAFVKKTIKLFIGGSEAHSGSSSRSELTATGLSTSSSRVSGMAGSFSSISGSSGNGSLTGAGSIVSSAGSRVGASDTTNPPTQATRALAVANTIQVYFNNTIGQVDSKIFGNNLLGNATFISSPILTFQSHSNFGTGIWDPQTKRPVQEVVDLGKKIKIGALRFPGGGATDTYDWKKTIGKGRTSFLFGMDEFLKICEIIGAEPVITISYFIGNENDAADLIEYLNAPDDGTHPWATRRAENGHPSPYGVKYFEISNEPWTKVSAETYAQRYLLYYDALKSADSTVQVGVVLYTLAWTEVVSGIVKGKADFGILHFYPTPVWGAALETIPADEIFRVSLEQPVNIDEYLISQAQKNFRENSGKLLPMAITEFNGGYVQDIPVPYRHTLGCALVNAELLHIFLKPENKIFLANYWQYLNTYTGMISNGFIGYSNKLYNPYYKRPNYYVFELYADHFGSTLIRTDVSGAWFSVDGGLVSKIGTIASSNLLSSVWQVMPVTGVKATQASGVLTLDFHNPVSFDYYHSKQNANVEGGAYYRISGYIKADKLLDDKGFGIEVFDSRGIGITPPVMTNKVYGTTDWIFVQALYLAPPDAKGVRVRVRRIGLTGPLDGRVSIRDVKLEKFVPSYNTIKGTYLSVNASKSADGNKMYLMVLNKDLNYSQTATITVNGFTPGSIGRAYVLNGSSIVSTNEDNHYNVKITSETFDVPLSGTFDYTFEPHSVTAIELENRF